MIVFHITFFLNIISNKGYCDVFTSVEDMKSVLEIEKNLTGLLENYIETEKRKINLLERYLIGQKEQHEIAFKDVESYISNPINTFHLIKRLTTDWENLEPFINANNSLEFLQKVSQLKNDLKFPTEDDLLGVVTCLLRLQDTYRISEKSLIKGVIDGQQYNSTLSGSDCYELGRIAYLIKDFFRAFMWLQQADEKLKEIEGPFSKRAVILSSLAVSAYSCGYTELAISYTEKLLKISPNNEEALNNLALFTKKSNRQRGMLKCRLDITPSNLLCKKETETPQKIASKLKCNYVDNNNPYLLIGPFKVEQLHLNPKIVMFHDVIFENEIEYIKKITWSKLQRAQVQKKNARQIASERIGKVAWLYEENTDDVLIKINKRISDMTSLDVTYAEPLQVSNYGIGGFYLQHVDYLGLSDVEQGGATAFTRINVTVFPQKGTAIFWHNLDPYGKGVRDTLHTACPVIYGSKWVVNKWIREAGQELHRPCPLKKTPRYLNKNTK